jgi:hypothetical protein
MQLLHENKLKLVFLISIFLIGSISASYSDCSLYGNCKPISSVVTGGNYTINTNNSVYFQGYTPTSLGYWLQTMFEWITNEVNDLENYYTKTEIDASYVPYNGATNNFNTSYNITTSNHLIISNGTSGVTHWNMYEDANGTLVWEKK